MKKPRRNRPTAAQLAQREENGGFAAALVGLINALGAFSERRPNDDAAVQLAGAVQAFVYAINAPTVETLRAIAQRSAGGLDELNARVAILEKLALKRGRK